MPVAKPRQWPERLRLPVLALLTAFGLYLCGLMALPFFAALTWAVVLAVLFLPLQRWLEAKLKSPNRAALVAVLLIGPIVVLPLSFVAQQLVQQAVQGAQLVETRVESGDWRRALAAQPRLAAIVDEIETRVDVPGTVKAATARLSSVAGSVVRGSALQVLGFALTFYLLFFLLRDREAALKGLRALSPLESADMDRLLSRVGDTIHATVYGTLAVSSVQGLLGGLMFWALGLSAPLLWGLVMTLLALVPVLGAFVVWLPAALYLALEGSLVKALILTAWGLLVVGTVDNLLRPILVGKRLQLHTVLAFISVVGGLIVFGASGLILGPVTLTISLVLLEVWAAQGDSADAS